MSNDPKSKSIPQDFVQRNEGFHTELKKLMEKYSVGLTTAFHVLGGEVQPDTIRIEVIDLLGKSQQ